MSAPPYSHPPPHAPMAPSRLYSLATVILVAGAAFLVGTTVGLTTMMLLRPSAEPVANTSTSTEETEPEEEVEPAESAAASASAVPTADAAKLAAQRQLAALRKKVKRGRSTMLDKQCARFKDKKFSVGYLFQGGTFKENEYVANASGCVALAKTTQAPWFCCRQ